QFTLTAPIDSRLPGGGGYGVSGLYNVKPNLPNGASGFNSINNFITSSDNFGDMIQHWNGFDITLNGRLHSIVWQGGTSTGRDSWNSCDVRSKLPELTTSGSATAGVTNLSAGSIGPTAPYCSGSTKFLTQFKGLASYVIPKIDVNVAATFQSIPNFVSTGQGV